MKLCLPAQPLRVLLLFGFAVLCIHWLLSAPGDSNARANEMKKPEPAGWIVPLQQGLCFVDLGENQFFESEKMYYTTTDTIHEIVISGNICSKKAFVGII